ncbi:DCC1-like thiol-disulfide oxidoreductase family protein [Paralimibaculum aggregatum]|uniref:DCC1-like thiol-disulfide oxidoreductase family protein n=1 Tax=Paralimibaculum aggregatum TaxID=3036245 RepID=A0ABQ6LQQ2_9RHOB|nr:DCC1-like thiol-disulfide oxidoreductase family protein [Limibaculum sp. NKW23]GMG83953.1 DCC1-like thiol-disulfide oxidoreductase family protein [Limibaculum sp. NKW23]
MGIRNHIIYDGDCPFCSSYVGLMRLKQAIGPVALIDAREGGPEVERARALGFDLDDGMLLHLDGRDHHGADCLNRLALLSTRSGLFNRLSAWLFRSETLARVAYPLLRAGRNATLMLLGRRRLGPARR